MIASADGQGPRTYPDNGDFMGLMGLMAQYAHTLVMTRSHGSYESHKSQERPRASPHVPLSSLEHEAAKPFGDHLDGRWGAERLESDAGSDALDADGPGGAFLRSSAGELVKRDGDFRGPALR